MTLYDIDKNIAEAIEKAIDPETGEVADEKALEYLEQLQMDREKKIEGAILYYKECIAEAEAIKAEKQALEARQKKKERKAESLKKYIDYALQGEKFQTAKCDVRYRKSETLEITDMDLIPVEYLKAEITAKKQDIKNAIKSGVNIKGVAIKSQKSIIIK